MTDITLPTTPTDAGELAAILREASAQDRPVVPRGGGTALAIGNLVEGDALPLDVTRIAGIRDYRPADLTLSVYAGTRVAELRQALAEHGQELPIDTPLPREATIGGLVATGYAGPRRLGAGSLKDLLLGCDYVRGDGLVAKAGGQVVKNVSGFEIPRLLHGSWGSLAVVTSVNFKVTPIPKAERTLQWEFPAAAEAIAAAHQIRIEQPSVSAVDVLQFEGTVTLAVRLMGRTGALDAQTTDLFDHHGTCAPLEDADSRDWWQQRVDRYADPGAGVQVVLAARPRFIAEAFTELESRLALDPAASAAAVSPGLGVARLRFAVDAVAAGDFWRLAAPGNLPGAARLLVEFAPDGWKRDLDIWGDPPAGIDVMRAIKQQFDPKGILNRGRLFV